MKRLFLMIVFFVFLVGALNARNERVPNGDGQGGTGGGRFDDSEMWSGDWGPISQIIIRSGSNIDGVGFVYENDKSVYHGGLGGASKQVNLKTPDEYIYKVGVRAKKFVRSLTFHTKYKGKESKTYKFGDFSDTSIPEKNFDFNNKALLYIFGRSGRYLDAIGFCHGQQPESSGNKVIRSIAFGGNKGGEWEDTDPAGLGRITSIEIRSGERIDKISTTYMVEDSAKTFSHGGTGGNSKTTTFRDGEYIIKVEGRSGARVDALTFTTNQDRVLHYGDGRGGGPFTIKRPGRDYVVVGFFGRSGTELDQIGVRWGKIKRIIKKIDVLSMNYLLDKGIFSNEPPEIAAQQDLVNRSELVQSISQSYTYTKTKSATVSISEAHSAGGSVTVGFEQQFGAPAVSQSKLSVSATANYSYTHTKNNTESSDESKQISNNFYTNVGPNSKITAKAFFERQTINVPWNGKARITYNDGATEEKDISGTWTGVDQVNARVEYGPSIPLTEQ